MPHISLGLHCPSEPHKAGTVFHFPRHPPLNSLPPPPFFSSDTHIPCQMSLRSITFITFFQSLQQLETPPLTLLIPPGSSVSTKLPFHHPICFTWPLLLCPPPMNSTFLSLGLHTFSSRWELPLPLLKIKTDDLTLVIHSQAGLWGILRPWIWSQVVWSRLKEREVKMQYVIYLNAGQHTKVKKDKSVNDSAWDHQVFPKVAREGGTQHMDVLFLCPSVCHCRKQDARVDRP